MPETMTTSIPEEETRVVPPQNTEVKALKISTQEQSSTPEKQNAAQQAIEEQTAKTQKETAQETTHLQTQLETKTTQQHVLENFLETQANMEEVEEKISTLSKKIQPKNGELSLSAEQIQEIQTLEALLSKAKIGLQPQDLRQLMLQSPDFLDTFIDQIEKDTKLEKKRKKQFKKAAKEMKKNLEAKQENNYYFQQLLSFSQIRNDLENGNYLNTQFTILKKNPLFVKIYTNRKNLSQQGAIQLNIDGQTINVYNEARLRDSKIAYGQLVNCNQPQNIAEKLLTENTEIPLSKAREMLGIGGTLAAATGIFMLGRWLFTQKEKDGSRKFSFSFEKLAALVGVPLLLNYGSYMASGEGILTHLQRAWKDGVWPWENLSKTSDPVEQLAIQQTTGQFALLGVPYGALQQCVKYKNGVAAEIEAGKLLEYYKNALQDAQKRKDSVAENRIGMQIKSVESILANEKAKIILNNALFNLNIQEDVLKNPANSNLTLDAKLSENNERSKQLEFYLKNKNLRINPTKNSELMTKVFSSEKALDESELNDLLEENFFLPNDMTYQELEKLTTLPEAQRKLIYEAFKKLKQSPDYQNIKLEALANGKIKILSNGNESTIEPVTRTLEGLKNRFGEIRFESQEELMRTALLVNAIRMHERIWGESPDHFRANEENWPFDIGNSLTKSIYFKKNGGDEEVIISDLLPVVSNMDWNFPTLEAGENRIFFAKYLNELWKNDPNTKKGTPPQSASPQTPQKK